MSRTLILLIASFGFVPCSGCGIPLMVAVVPCVGAGRVVEFRDWKGNSIDTDGLLLVCRHRDWRPILKVKSAMTTHVVEVRRGEARIPVECVPASLWIDLTPVGKSLKPLAELTGEVWSGSASTGGLGFFMLGIAYGIVTAPVILPAEELYLIPLIHGHSAMISTTFGSPYRCSRNRMLTDSPISSDLPLRLTANGDDRDAAQSFWEFAHERILPPGAQFDSQRGLEVRMLYKSDYQRVQQLIDEELIRIRSETVQPEKSG